MNKDFEATASLTSGRQNSDLFCPSSPQKQQSIQKRLERDPNFALYQSVMADREAGINNITQQDLLALACKIAANSDIKTDNLVLFSTTKENQNKAEDFTEKNEDADVIHTTPAGWMLERLELFNPALSPVDYEIAYLPWYVAALRLCLETTAENVTAYLDGSDELSTCRMVELTALLANDHVKTINGTPKEELKALTTPHFFEWAHAVAHHDDVSAFRGVKNELKEKFASKVGQPNSIEEETLKHLIRRGVIIEHLQSLHKRLKL